MIFVYINSCYIFNTLILSSVSFVYFSHTFLYFMFLVDNQGMIFWIRPCTRTKWPMPKFSLTTKARPLTAHWVSPLFFRSLNNLLLNTRPPWSQFDQHFRGLLRLFPFTKKLQTQTIGIENLWKQFHINRCSWNVDEIDTWSQFHRHIMNRFCTKFLKPFLVQMYQNIASSAIAQ